jgi:hypothetical protein
MSRFRMASLALASIVVPAALSAQANPQTSKRPPMAAAPAAQRAAVATQSARCNDNTMWSGAERQGACTNHGGVKEWINVHAWAAGQTARCNDGSAWTNESRQGACTGHGGVKAWRVDDDDEQGRPRNATARCNDGSWWTATARQGACAGHNGVHHWLGSARH